MNKSLALSSGFGVFRILVGLAWIVSAILAIAHGAEVFSVLALTGLTVAAWGSFEAIHLGLSHPEKIWEMMRRFVQWILRDIKEPDGLISSSVGFLVLATVGYSLIGVFAGGWLAVVAVANAVLVFLTAAVFAAVFQTQWTVGEIARPLGRLLARVAGWVWAGLALWVLMMTCFSLGLVPAYFEGYMTGREFRTTLGIIAGVSTVCVWLPFVLGAIFLAAARRFQPKPDGRETRPVRQVPSSDWWMIRWILVGLIGLGLVAWGLVLLRPAPVEVLPVKPNPWPPRPVVEPILPLAGGCCLEEQPIYPWPFRTGRTDGLPIYDRPWRPPGIGQTVAVLDKGEGGELYYNASGKDPENPGSDYHAAAGIFYDNGRPVWGWVPLSSLTDEEALRDLPNAGPWNPFTGELVGDPRPWWGEVPQVMRAADGTLGSWDYDQFYYTLHVLIGEGEFTVVARPAGDCREVGGWWSLQVFWGWPRFAYPGDLPCGGATETEATGLPAFRLKYIDDVNPVVTAEELIVLPLGLRANRLETEALGDQTDLTVSIKYFGQISVADWRERFEITISKR